MAKKPKARIVVTKKVTGSCYIYSDIGPTRCFLCGVLVPKSTPHACEKKE